MQTPDNWFFTYHDLPLGYRRDDDDDDDEFVGVRLSTDVWGEESNEDERRHGNDRRNV